MPPGRQNGPTPPCDFAARLTARDQGEVGERGSRGAVLVHEDAGQGEDQRGRDGRASPLQRAVIDGLASSKPRRSTGDRSADRIYIAPGPIRTLCCSVTPLRAPSDSSTRDRCGERRAERPRRTTATAP